MTRAQRHVFPRPYPLHAALVLGDDDHICGKVEPSPARPTPTPLFSLDLVHRGGHSRSMGPKPASRGENKAWFEPPLADGGAGRMRIQSIAGSQATLHPRADFFFSKSFRLTCQTRLQRARVAPSRALFGAGSRGCWWVSRRHFGRQGSYWYV